jgi:hypothetical protein
MGFVPIFRDGRDRPGLGTARLRVYYPGLPVSLETWTWTWSMCVSHVPLAPGGGPQASRNVQVRGCRDPGAAEERETAVAKEKVAGANPWPGAHALGSLRALESSDGPSRTNPDDHGSHEARGSENHAVSPSARGCGSVLARGRVIGWKYWTPNHKKATDVA